MSQSKHLLKAAVAYGNLSLGDHEGRLPLTFRRADLSVEQAEEYFCSARLTARIIARPEGVGATQGALPGLDGDVSLDGVWDAAGFRVNRKQISTTIVFQLSGLAITKLAKFSGREGMLTVTAVDYLEDSPAATKATAGEEAEAA